jgi:hypothetical protein
MAPSGYPRISSALLIITTISLTLFTATRAHAQSAEAEALFRQGVQLEGDGKIAEACNVFAASNRIEQRAGTLLQLGQCRLLNHQLASAWAAFSDSAARAKDPAKRRSAQAALAEIEPRLSYVTVSVPEESQVAGLVLTRNGEPFDPMLWNRAIPVDGGKFEIGGHAPGHEEWKTSAQVPDEHGNVHIDVPKFKSLAELIPSPAGTVMTSTVVEKSTDDEPAPRRIESSRVVPYTLGGTGLGLGIVAAVLELAARTKISDARQLCGAELQCSEPSYGQAQALLQAAASREHLAIAAGALGIASIGVGAYLFVRARRSEHAAATARIGVTPAADHHMVAVFVGGSF